MVGFSTERQRHATRKLQVKSRTWKGSWLLIISATMLLLVSVLWASVKLRDPNLFPVRSVQITGTYPHVAREVLQKTVMAFVHKGFFVIDVDGLRESLMRLPWVYEVSVSRVWPDKLQVDLQEQEPVARWGGSGFINTHGELFNLEQKDAILASLPLLEGPVGEHALVLKNFQDMTTLLSPLGLKIISMTLAARHAWRVQLNNGMVLMLGRDDYQARLERFVKVYRQIFMGQNKAADYVDLRYNHGMAVHWASV